ncbi:hypothetical protein [Hymenobacter jeollabukensis]|uniref:BRCT domain-containing protein n=1 Tax=Hymenobacter jeollabukensis TaxID=2025313 RepID=A0A5R8WV98_9BACT|nr:hypothetical protein [Hymenobacter jeollabukensis]TLM96440.1 hypothetical protein FDY95_00105 [Hymenobacter jeollabukensis]
MDSTAERLQELIRIVGAKSVSAFAVSIGVRSTVLANMLGGRMSKPSFDTLEKIKAQYPQVDLEWLVMGKGQPLKAATAYSLPAQPVPGASEPDIKLLGKPELTDKTSPQAALAECQKELTAWKEKAETYRQLAEDRQTIIELMKKAAR